MHIQFSTNVVQSQSQEEINMFQICHIIVNYYNNDPAEMNLLK